MAAAAGLSPSYIVYWHQQRERIDIWLFTIAKSSVQLGSIENGLENYYIHTAGYRMLNGLLPLKTGLFGTYTLV